MTETKTTKNVLNHDDLMNTLSAEVTRMVVAFAKQGYIIDCNFGGYSDGAEARVSMTDGNGWYQIRVEHEYSLLGYDEFGHCEGYAIRILRFDADYASAKTGTLWAKDGEVVYTENWYQHGSGRKCVYTNDTDEWDRMHALSASRYSGRSTNREVGYNPKTILAILKKRSGYKRVKAEDIKGVYRMTTYNHKVGYCIELNRKVSKQAATSVCFSL